MPKTSPRRKVDKVGEQHRQLRASTDELRALLATPRPSRDAKRASEWTNRVARHWTDFEAELRRHFRTEERAGMLVELADGTPSSARKISRLLADHERILVEVRDALQALTSEPATGRKRIDPRRLALAALEHLERHDHAESELMQSFVCDELGAGD